MEVGASAEAQGLTGSIPADMSPSEGHSQTLALQLCGLRHTVTLSNLSVPSILWT